MTKFLLFHFFASPLFGIICFVDSPIDFCFCLIATYFESFNRIFSLIINGRLHKSCLRMWSHVQNRTFHCENAQLKRIISALFSSHQKFNKKNSALSRKPATQRRNAMYLMCFKESLIKHNLRWLCNMPFVDMNEIPKGNDVNDFICICAHGSRKQRLFPSCHFHNIRHFYLFKSFSSWLVEKLNNKEQ